MRRGFWPRRSAQWASRADGKRELEARAFGEYQKTKRAEAGYGLLRDAFTSIASAWPAVQDVITTMTGKPAQSLPKFECSQHAIGYLYMTLEPERLASVLAGSSNADKLSKAQDMLALFDSCSRMPDEREMLARVEPLIRNVLTRDRFRAVVLPEQNIAVQYIAGRAAFFRFMEAEMNGDA